MLERLMNRLNRRPTNACFCTLAIHTPYRRRAQLLIADVPEVPWIVLTDEPEDFANLPVHAIRHEPTGPMAIDFQTKFPPLGQGLGRPAYHDKRFVLQAALKDFDTAIFIDADSRITSLPRLPNFAPGIAVDKSLQTSISDHLSKYGEWRRPALEQLALELTGNLKTLNAARWCGEALFAVTRDGNEAKFFEAWERSARFLHDREVYSGEGGVIGLAAVYAGWTVDYHTLTRLAAAVQHEGLGPKIK